MFKRRIEMKKGSSIKLTLCLKEVASMLKRVKIFKPLVISLVIIAVISVSGTAFSKDFKILPHASVKPSGEILIEWETTNPTTGAVVYLGIANEDDTIAYPRYRKEIKEKSTEVSTFHQVSILPEKTEVHHHRLVVPERVCYYRVKCFDTFNKKIIPSKNYKFRYVLDKNKNAIQTIVIDEGPMVCKLTSSSVTIRWKTSKPSYGSVNSNGKTVKDAGGLKILHEVKLDGLWPDTRYNYSVKSWSNDPLDTVESREYYFFTAPEREKPFSFAVLSDSRADKFNEGGNLNEVNVRALKALTAHAYARGAKFILFPGDLVTGYSDDVDYMRLQYSTWESTIEPISHYIPIYTGMGNHEVIFEEGTKRNRPSPESAEEIFAEEFTNPENSPEPDSGMPPYSENVYSFDYGKSHFVMLNSDYHFKEDPDRYKYSRRIDKNQREWLRKDLESARKRGMKHIFVFFHEPAYPNGGHTHDTLNLYPNERDAFWKILDDYRVDAVFCGHEHNYNRTLVDKRINPNWRSRIYQIITGGAGGPFYFQDPMPWTPWVEKFSIDENYVLVTVKDSEVSAEVYNLNGELIDSFVITK